MGQPIYLPAMPRIDRSCRVGIHADFGILRRRWWRALWIPEPPDRQLHVHRYGNDWQRIECGIGFDPCRGYGAVSDWDISRTFDLTRGRKRRASRVLAGKD
jgi:hypothetical protein